MSHSDIIRNTYDAPPALVDFMDDMSFVRGIMGPIGSGKSSIAMCMDALFKACRQTPSPKDNVRYAKELILRASEPRLKTTTIPTWKQWIKPEQFQSFMKMDTPIEHHFKFQQKPGDTVDIHVIFMSVLPGEEEKLNSFECSRARINEATEVGFSLVKKAVERVNRFPAKKEHGVDCDEPGLVMDFNPPNFDHWIYDRMEKKTPSGWRFWKQPAALFEVEEEGLVVLDTDLISSDGVRFRINPMADNLKNLAKDYYQNQVSTLTSAEVRVKMCNKFGLIIEGDPVHPGFSDKRHYAGQPLAPYPGLPLILGFDGGGTPACVICQYTPKGQLRVLDEICADYFTSFNRFFDQRVVPHLAQFYSNFDKIIGWGDPSLNAGQGYEETPFQMMNKKFGEGAIKPSPDPQNVFRTRAKALDRMLAMGEGDSAILLSSKVQMIRAGLSGRYFIAKVKTGPQQGNLPKLIEPTKNEFSHICEALQYVCLGIMGKPKTEQSDAILSMVNAYNKSLQPMDHDAGY